MKRKLDEADVPVAADANLAGDISTVQKDTEFSDFGLDSSLLQAISSKRFKEPTLVQRKAIPLALEGKDILAKAKTGSGKTIAYLVPVIQSVLRRKQLDPTPCTSALLLVPTRELANQVFGVIQSLVEFCAKDVQAIKLADRVSETVQRSLLSNSPDIVVSTPSRAWSNIRSGALLLDKLTHLVLDEADLVLSYGYSEDLDNVAKKLPKGVQTIMMSATLTTEVDTLKGIFCRSPVVLDLEEKDDEGEGVTQYVVKCGEDEKFLIIYVIYKLKLVQGKSIIFVADVDRCYRLKLYLEQFGIRSCVLNSELPVNSRIHVVEEFNRNVYDVIIASDETEVVGDEDEEKPRLDGEEASDGKEKKKKQKSRKVKKDKEYGVSRGIDFKNVACVLNFDLPTSAKSYTHRIGRTARAGQRGMALSFVVPEKLYRKHVPTSIDSCEHDERVLARIEKQQAKKGKGVLPYNFDMGQVDAFRYRMNDALRAVTKVAIREARIRELREELAKSEKLKRHFEENPGELQHLRHDNELRTARTQDHLKHVPDYLLPEEGRKDLTAEVIGYVPLRKYSDRRNKRGGSHRSRGGGHGGKSFRVGKRKTDPLKNFKPRARK